MSQVDRKLTTGNESQNASHYVFKIRKSGAQLLLAFPDSSEFGLLNTHTSQALEDLVEHPSIQFEALAQIVTLRETIGRVAKASEAIARVNINVYGSPDDSKHVGRHLSTKKVYLQRPDQLRPGSVYDNPHFLRVPGIQESTIYHKLEERSTGASRSGIDDIERFQKTVSDVYASLKRGSGLKRLEGDNRLKTRLLP
jgi:SWI/SNF-related matrix-associated actin-dependent regulator of chromatin subfamily A3